MQFFNFFFFLGNAQYLEQQQQMQNGEIKRKESLSPPPKREVTWSEYIQSPAGQHPVLGRASKCKESSRAFKATVAMSEDFPLTVEMLLNVLEVIAPQFKHFQKLRDFIEMKLPPGFPVKVDIPVNLKKKKIWENRKNWRMNFYYYFPSIWRVFSTFTFWILQIDKLIFTNFFSQFDVFFFYIPKTKNEEQNWKKKRKKFKKLKFSVNFTWFFYKYFKLMN